MLRTAWAHGEGLSRWIVYFSSRQAKCYPWWGQTLSELCAWNSVLVFCPDVFTFLGTTVPLASTKNGSGTRLLKFTAEFIEAMPFLKTHGKNFIVVSRPRAMEFLLRIKIFFFPPKRSEILTSDQPQGRQNLAGLKTSRQFLKQVANSNGELGVGDRNHQFLKS